MVERIKIVVPTAPPPATPDPTKEEFFSSGSHLLDLILGGGWAMRRVFNLVGDKSTGKTLLAIEGMANFKMKYKNGKVRYGEAEAALDEQFAQTLGLPEDVERPEEQLHTVEEFRDDLKAFMKGLDKDQPGLYVLDSLDALSDEAEVKAYEKGKKNEDGSDKGSYGTAKAKKLSEMFRLMTQDISKSYCSLGIISQIRDRIGVTFGETKQRSGGHALDFYASQIIWLAEIQKIKRTALSVERAVGVEILANCKKCKVGFPFRKAEMDITFGYGVDNEISMLKWLKDSKAFTDAQFKEYKDAVEAAREQTDYTTLRTIEAQLKKTTTERWMEIESRLAPRVKKYAQGASTGA